MAVFQFVICSDSSSSMHCEYVGRHAVNGKPLHFKHKTTSWGSVHFLFMDATSQVRVGAQPLYILLYLKVLFKPKKGKCQ
jgi:hypothetical protein